MPCCTDPGSPRTPPTIQCQTRQAPSNPTQHCTATCCSATSSSGSCRGCGEKVLVMDVEVPHQLLQRILHLRLQLCQLRLAVCVPAEEGHQPQAVHCRLLRLLLMVVPPYGAACNSCNT